MAIATGAVQEAYVGTTYQTALGIVTGGEWGDDAKLVLREGIGGVGTYVAGLMDPGATLDIIPVDSNCLLDKVLRASYPVGALTAFKLHIGDDANGRYGAAWYVDSADISMSVENALAVKYALRHDGKFTTGTNANTYSSPKTTFEWYRGAVTVAGSAAQAISFSASVKNNLIQRPTLDSKVAASLRYAAALDVGPQEVEVSVEFLTDPALNLTGDALATATVVCTANNGTGTYTFTMTSGKVSKWSSALADSKKHKTYAVTYVLDHNSSAFTIAYA